MGREPSSHIDPPFGGNPWPSQAPPRGNPALETPGTNFRKGCPKPLSPGVRNWWNFPFGGNESKAPGKFPPGVNPLFEMSPFLNPEMGAPCPKPPRKPPPPGNPNLKWNPRNLFPFFPGIPETLLKGFLPSKFQGLGPFKGPKLMNLLTLTRNFSQTRVMEPKPFRKAFKVTSLRGDRPSQTTHQALSSGWITSAS